MANQVKNLDEKIIASAKVEFLRAGYNGAFLRQIALGAGTSTGSIYSRNYNKEKLFTAVVEPATSEFIEQIKTSCVPRNTEIWAEEFQRDFWMEQLDFLYKHMEEFLLLLTNSSPSRYSNYKETLATLAAQPIYNYYAEKLKSQKIEQDFIVSIYTSLFACLFEIVLHRIKKEDALKYISQLCSYVSGGWQSVLL